LLKFAPNSNDVYTLFSYYVNDPNFGHMLRTAVASGVEPYVLNSRVTRGEIVIDKQISVLL